MPGLTGAIRTMTITNNGWQLHERIMAITMETITDARKKSVKKKTRQRPGLSLRYCTVSVKLVEL
jgi:hypothetical protein